MKDPLALFCARLVLFLAILVMGSCSQSSKKDIKETKKTDLTFAYELKNRGSYDSAIIFFKKASDQNLKLNHFSDWVTAASGLIDSYRSKGDLDEAIRLTDQILEIAKVKIDTSGNSFNWLIHKKALLYSDKRQFDLATSLFNRNIKIFLNRSAGDADTGLALSYNGLGSVYLNQTRFADALIEYNKALKTYEKANYTRNSNYASSLQNVGIVYSTTGNFEKAEQYFLKSLKVNQEVLQASDPKLATFYLNMGRFYQIVRNDSKSIEYMKRAENFYISQNQSNSILAGILFLNMGVIYIYTADYEKAQSYLDKSLDIMLAKSPDNLDVLLTLYLNMGFVAEKKGDYFTAKNYYLKGLAIGVKFQNSVKILRALANVSYKMNDVSSANTYYKMALEKSVEMYGKEHPETALTNLRFGDFLSDIGDKTALVYLNNSLSLYKKSFGLVNADVSTAYSYIGSYYFRIKNYTTALHYFQQALISGFPGFTSQNTEENPKIDKATLNNALLYPLSYKALSLLLLYQSDTAKVENLKNSTTSFRLCLDMIEVLRSTYQDENSKLFISENENKTFANALLSQVTYYQKTKNMAALDEAFSLSEKGKSAVLLSYLRDKEAKDIGRIPVNLLNQDASLKSEIYFYNKQIHDQKLLARPDEQKIKMWNSKVFDLSRKQDELINSIEKNFPSYYNLKYDNSVISIKEIQKKLSSNQAIVEFSMTDKTVYAFAITAGTRQLFTTNIDSTFLKNLQTIRTQLTGKDYNNYTTSDFKTFVTTSYNLYKTLLLPVQSAIKGKELIIIPDGELGYLSFDILLTSSPDTTKAAYRKLPYLIKESAITYAPSATTFFDELNRKNTKNNGSILAFGPEYGTQNSVLFQKDDKGKILRKSLPNLTNTKEEIKSLKRYFKVDTYLDKKATESAFKKNAAGYQILHLAMHTIISDDNPLYSKLIFFKSDSDSADDGMLNASELINMELHADMAVLSACNTGSGKMSKGEGIMSLSRNFFYAGVPGIIMTAWAVEDRAGVKLMDNFYKYIAEGKPRHVALRLAKIEYLDNCDKLTSHPHYWASYMNVGDISPLNGFGKKHNPLAVFGGIGLIIAIAVFLLIPLLKRDHMQKPVVKP